MPAQGSGRTTYLALPPSPLRQRFDCGFTKQAGEKLPGDRPRGVGRICAENCKDVVSTVLPLTRLQLALQERRRWKSSDTARIFATKILNPDRKVGFVNNSASFKILAVHTCNYRILYRGVTHQRSNYTVVNESRLSMMSSVSFGGSVTDCLVVPLSLLGVRSRGGHHLQLALVLGKRTLEFHRDCRANVKSWSATMLKTRADVSRCIPVNVECPLHYLDSNVFPSYGFGGSATVAYGQYYFLLRSFIRYRLGLLMLSCSYAACSGWDSNAWEGESL